MKRILLSIMCLSIFVVACERQVYFNEDGDVQDEFNDFVVSGKSKMNDGDFDGAIENLTKAIDIKQDAETFVTLAQAKFRNGDPKGALEDINKALLLKEDSNYYMRRAEIQQSLENFPEALSDIEKSLAINGEDEWAYSVRSQIKFIMGNNEGALEDINQAILKPVNWQSNKGIFYSDRAKIKLEMNDKQGALEDINEGLKIIESLRGSDRAEELMSPPEIQALYKLRSDIKLSLGDEKGALEDIKKSKNIK